MSERPRTPISHAFIELPDREMIRLAGCLSFMFPLLRIDEAQPWEQTLDYVWVEEYPEDKHEERRPRSVKIKYVCGVIDVPDTRIYHYAGPRFLSASMAIYWLGKVHDPKFDGQPARLVVAEVRLIPVTPAEALRGLVDTEIT
jgi:hypothetical protein